MTKQNPFSLYDFMGYFIPGSLIVYLYLLTEFVKQNTKFDLNKFISENNNVQLQSLLFFLIISYSLGHLINFISSITIEKYSNWKYGYPSKYLLGLSKEKYWSNKEFSGIFKKIIIPIILLPVTVMDYILGDLMGFKQFYTKKLDDFLVEIIKGNGEVLIRKIHSNFNPNNSEKKSIDLTEKDFFRIFMHYTFENSKNHQFKLVNYVSLYGFLRSLTLICIVIFWYLIYSCLKDVSKFNFYDFTPIITITFVAYVFFMAFMKFYRRYSLEVLMLIAIDKELFNGNK